MHALCKKVNQVPRDVIRKAWNFCYHSCRNATLPLLWFVNRLKEQWNMILKFLNGMKKNWVLKITKASFYLEVK